jgi:ketosteroid isomerase-like protein
MIANTLSLKQDVDATREQHIAAVRSGNVEAAVGLFDPQGILLPPGAPPLEGKHAIRAWFQQVFANFRVDGFAIEPGGLEERGDLAIEHGNWSAIFQPKDGSPGMPAGGSYLTVYARLSDGSVRILRDSFNGLPGR